MPTVAVGSTNPTKIEAVRIAFAKVFPKKTWTVTGIAVSSGIADQPKKDTETITGATNRAQKAMKQIDADFGVGLEGGMQEVAGHWMETGWIVVIDKNGTTGIGSSIRMEIPRKILELIKQGDELGIAVDTVFQRHNAKQAEGFFGLMSSGVLDRANAYADGVVSALTRFLHPELF